MILIKIYFERCIYKDTKKKKWEKHFLLPVQNHWRGHRPDMSCKIHFQSPASTQLIPASCLVFRFLFRFSFFSYFYTFTFKNCVQSLPLGIAQKLARCTNALLISMLLKCNQDKRFNFSNAFDISWPFKCLDPSAGLVPVALHLDAA